MPIQVLRHMTPRQVRDAVNSFAPRYVNDWNGWLDADDADRPNLFGKILRKWQATRPRAMRRLRHEAEHDAPFLDDLLDMSAEPIQELNALSVLAIAERTPRQHNALTKLWEVFNELPQKGVASCVGISKAVLLLTDGKIGPAFDLRVRRNLHVARPPPPRGWVQILEEIAIDIGAFEAAHGPLTQVVPCRFAHLEYGRLYDMVLGPR